MNTLYVFLIRNDVWIYFLCGLGILWFGSELVRAQGRLRGTMFGLERENALRSRNNALLIVFLCAAIAVGVAYVNVFVRPTLPDSALRPPTPTADPFALPAPTSPVTTPLPEVSPTSPVVAPTVTLPGDPSATETPSIPGSPPPPTVVTATPVVAGCAPTAIITDPRSGTTVFGALNVFGSANIEEFAGYELEINGPQTNSRWASLLGRTITQPVDDGFLGGNVNLSTWASGVYLLRLSVLDTDGAITNQCVVDIVLDNG